MQTFELPIAPIWDDVTTLKKKHIPEEIEIIYGGFPCQDISCAGNGVGLSGKRSGLFFEIVRLAEEFAPQFIFLENVPAIRTRGLKEVVTTLSGLRYDCRWGMLSANEMGAPHRRDRWFLLAHTNREFLWLKSGRGIKPRRESSSVFGSTRLEKPLADAYRPRDGEKLASVSQLRTKASQRENETVPPFGGGASLANSDGIRRAQRLGEPKVRKGRPHPHLQSWWAVEPNVGRVAHGVPFRVDRLRGLGNAVVPAQAREAFMRLMGIK